MFQEKQTFFPEFLVKQVLTLRTGDVYTYHRWFSSFYNLLKENHCKVQIIYRINPTTKIFLVELRATFRSLMLSIILVMKCKIMNTRKLFKIYLKYQIYIIWDNSNIFLITNRKQMAAFYEIQRTKNNEVLTCKTDIFALISNSNCCQ